MSPVDFGAVTEAELAARSRKQGHVIADVKGAPTFSIASSVARIISAIVYDNKAQIPLFGRLPDQIASLPAGPMPISHFREELGCCVSLPAFLGRDGVVKTVDVKLEEPEERKLVRGGVSVGETVERLMENSTVAAK
jgi:L-lactate dehydrogenase